MPAQLRPVPEVPPRVLGLIRVSKERDGMVSPEVQRVAIGDYCRARGYTVVGWLEGIDESGSRARSAWWPRLEQAVGQVEAGAADGVVVWKFSRTARQRLKWATALDRVESAGGRLESATEQIDAATAVGRFTRGMLAELNAFEAERIGEVWQEVQARRVRNGLPHNGGPRVGYVYDLEQKLHVPDPETAPVIASLFDRFISGESFYSLVRDLNGRGMRTTTGGLWTDRSLRRALDSGFHAGFVAYKGELHPGRHEPLIDEGVWQAFRDARGLRRRMPARSVSSRYVLSGLVRCGVCEGSMNAGTFGKARVPKFRCERRRATAGAGCGGGYVSAAFVDEQLLVWLREQAEDVEVAARSVDLGGRRREALVGEVERLAREITRLESALLRLTQTHAEDPESDEVVFRAARGDYRLRLVELRRRHEEASRAARVVVDVPAVVAGSLLEEWHVLPVEHRREQVRRLVARVMVWTRERGTPARVRVVPLWDA